MSPAAPEAPAYGGGGDTLGARRSRRAFIFCVLSCVVVTGLLWFAERYLRYERAEQLYQQALTHVNDSAAQVFLRNAVELDMEQSPYASPRYLWALAERQTGEAALNAFAEACAQDPRNAGLAMRYGTALYLEGRVEEAAAYFEQASAHAPENALPLYLKAAARAYGNDNNNADRLAESLAVVARANAGGREVRYPPPVWSGDLPGDGQWRAYQRRRIVEETGMVLRRYANHVLTAFRNAAEETGQAAAWDVWLSELEEMGERVARVPEGGTRALVNGLLIQRNTLRERQAMSESADGDAFIPEPDDVSQRLAEVEDALLVLSAFEGHWVAWAGEERQQRMFPWRLAGYTLTALAALVAALGIAGRLMGITREHWTIGHGRNLTRVMAGAGVLFLSCLALGAAAPHWSAQPAPWFTTISVVWLAGLAGVGGYAFYYPRTVLTPPGAPERAAATAKEEHNVTQTPSSGYRRAYVALVRRYAGVLFGVLVCAGCFWVLGFRLAVGLYPWEFRLLPSALVRDELALAAEILQRLG